MQSEADPGKQTRTVRRAVVLLSGGLDSATVLAMARAEGFECHALSVRYGQRHDAELHAAARVAAALGAHEHRVMGVDLAGIGGSALTDPHIDVPQRPQNPREPTRSPGLPDARGVAAEPAPPQGIPVTYVPARNTLLLSLALGWAEVLEARHIFVGVNAVDYSGYPDCRPEFIAAFERLANLATKAGVEGAQFEIRAPLIRLSKAQIVRRGVGLGLDYGMTVSCYLARGDGSACGRCDACRLRAMGFAEAGLPDPTRYASGSHGG